MSLDGEIVGKGNPPILLVGCKLVQPLERAVWWFVKKN